jgi:hypothetical protein
MLPSKVVMHMGVFVLSLTVWIETYNRMITIEHDFTTDIRPTYPQPTSSPVSASPTSAPIIDPNHIRFCKFQEFDMIAFRLFFLFVY